jgi:hypothetical protein
MLKISGTDGRSVGGAGGVGLGLVHGKGEGKGGEGKGGAGMTEGDFQALMLEFDSRMKVLRTVVEAGGKVGQRREGKERVAEGETTAEREEDTSATGDL